MGRSSGLMRKASLHAAHLESQVTGAVTFTRTTFSTAHSVEAPRKFSLLTALTEHNNNTQLKHTQEKQTVKGLSIRSCHC